MCSLDVEKALCERCLCSEVPPPSDPSWTCSKKSIGETGVGGEWFMGEWERWGALWQKKTCSMRCVQRLKGWANLVYWIQRRKNGNTWRLTAPQDDNRMSCNPVSVYYSKLNTINVQHPCKCATMNTWSGHIDFQLWNKSLHTMKAVEYSRKNIQQKKTEGIISAKTVCTVSSSYLCTFIAFSPCGESLGLMGTLLIPSPKIFILSECHWSFGRSNHFRKAVFSCVVSLQGSSSKRMKAGREGGEISYPCQEKWSHLSSRDLSNVSTR